MEEIKYERGKSFFLAKPSFWREKYELQDAGQTLALLFYPKWYSENAEINYLKGKNYQIYAKGFIPLKHYLREKGYENPIAEYEIKLFKFDDFLILPMGAKLRFVFKMGRDGGEIQTENGMTLVTVKKKSLFSFEYIIDIENNSELIDKYPWAILFFCYKLLQRRRRRH